MAFVLFILFVVAAVYLNLLWLIEVPGLYLGVAAVAQARTVVRRRSDRSASPASD